MRIAFSSRLKGIDQLQAKVKALQSRALRDLSQNMAEEALELVAEGFSKERDPYGDRWRRKKRPDGRQVLVGQTAALRRGWHVSKFSERGFTISPSVKYAGFHQTGTRRMPRRAMVPYRALPSQWRTAFQSAARDFLSAHFR